MFSTAVKTHWKLVYRSIKIAIKVTFREVIRGIKLMYQMKKRRDDLDRKKINYKKLRKHLA